MSISSTVKSNCPFIHCAGLLMILLGAAGCGASVDEHEGETGDAYRVKPKGNEGTREAYFAIEWPAGDLPDNAYACAVTMEWKGLKLTIKARDEAAHTLIDQSQAYDQAAPAKATLACTHVGSRWDWSTLVSGVQNARGSGKKADPFTVPIGRLDVDHVDVAHIEGAHRIVEGKWHLTSASTMWTTTWTAPTGTGIFVFPGTYRVYTEFTSINGSETDDQVAVIE